MVAGRLFGVAEQVGWRDSVEVAEPVILATLSFGPFVLGLVLLMSFILERTDWPAAAMVVETNLIFARHLSAQSDSQTTVVHLMPTL